MDLHDALQRRGLSAAQAACLLDCGGVGLRLRVWVGARHDSLAEYGLALLLDEGGAEAGRVPSLHAFVMRPCRHLGYMEDERVAPGAWQAVESAVGQVPGGARRAAVLLRGRRSPHAAPPPEGAAVPKYGGCKFASAQLLFAPCSGA